jgi:hypothetical protein
MLQRLTQAAALIFLAVFSLSSRTAFAQSCGVESRGIILSGEQTEITKFVEILSRQGLSLELKDGIYCLKLRLTGQEQDSVFLDYVTRILKAAKSDLRLLVVKNYPGHKMLEFAAENRKALGYSNIVLNDHLTVSEINRPLLLKGTLIHVLKEAADFASGLDFLNEPDKYDCDDALSGAHVRALCLEAQFYTSATKRDQGLIAYHCADQIDDNTIVFRVVLKNLQLNAQFRPKSASSSLYDLVLIEQHEKPFRVVNGFIGGSYCEK